MSEPTGQKCGIDCESVACARARNQLLVTGGRHPSFCWI